MLFHRLGLGFAPSSVNPDRRHCYARPSALDHLLETPGVLELLAEELGVTAEPAALSLVEQLEGIRGRAIHLSVTHSPFRGLSVEELIALVVYSSARFDHTAFKRELLRQPAQAELHHACEAWLRQRSSTLYNGQSLGRPQWPMVGCTSSDPLAPGQFTVAVLPILDHEALALQLERAGSEANFAHEHYLACSPATALNYLDRQAHLTRPTRWDSLALDRKLRTFGLGLLLVERDGVLLYLPARYQSRPP
jgi:hypothetical protein